MCSEREKNVCRKSNQGQVTDNWGLSFSRQPAGTGQSSQSKGLLLSVLPVSWKSQESLRACFPIIPATCWLNLVLPYEALHGMAGPLPSRNVGHKFFSNGFSFSLSTLSHLFKWKPHGHHLIHNGPEHHAFLLNACHISFLHLCVIV